MRKPLVAGNWKMNGSLGSNAALLRSVVAASAANTGVEVLVCPPSVFLPQAAEILAGSGVGIGAQNCSAYESGAYTGEISGAMLREFGCRYVIVGHSERRALFGEGDAEVASKAARALASGLTPIICVGETLEQRDGGQTLAVIARQLDVVIEKLGASALCDVVVAYEPVWAIGTGRTATPAQAQEVHAAIRAQLARASEQAATNVRILYGGSVKAGNAAEIFSMPDVDGGLIGGASLSGDEFAAICSAPVAK